MSTIYDYSIPTTDGKDKPLSDFHGKVLLIVNTATQCGFTPQYEELESLYEKYRDHGFEIVDIPCNQFGAQAPGSDEQIHQFCSLNFGTKFLRARKSIVNGEGELPLYTFLKREKGFEGFGEGDTAQFMNNFLFKNNPDAAKNPDIKWNFTKFLIDREGKVVARFEPTASMGAVGQAIAGLL